MADETERGLRFAHIMMMVGQTRGNEALAAIMALADILSAKGLISGEEFDQARKRAQEQVADMPQPHIRLGSLGDKYTDPETAEIDCHNRVHLCHARCCTFNFFLTAQDLDEGVARWDYGNPYWIKRREDGYCVHCDPSSRACTIHAQRPHICRVYDCRQDKRIWIDFEARIPAPIEPPMGPLPIALAEPNLGRNLMAEPDSEAATEEDS
jgi:hypothetical protein